MNSPPATVLRHIRTLESPRCQATSTGPSRSPHTPSPPALDPSSEPPNTKLTSQRPTATAKIAPQPTPPALVCPQPLHRARRRGRCRRHRDTWRGPGRGRLGTAERAGVGSEVADLVALHAVLQTCHPAPSQPHPLKWGHRQAPSGSYNSITPAPTWAHCIPHSASGGTVRSAKDVQSRHGHKDPHRDNPDAPPC